MAKYNADIYRLNAGLISDLAQVRKDLKRLALSAKVMTNWMPRSLGSMMLRPGLEYINRTFFDRKAYHIPFIFAANDTAILEFSENALRVRVNEAVVTRPSVATSVTNGTFTSNITGWTDDDDAGASSSWAAGYMVLEGTKYNRAIRTQLVSVASGDRGVVHALNIKVYRHKVRLRVGTTAGGEEYISEAVLGEGVHSLSFTPTGDFYIYLANETAYEALVDSVEISSSGSMTLETPYVEEDLGLLRFDQSGDIVFLCCDGYAQYKVERRGDSSWSFVKYTTTDGPFFSINTGYKTITPSSKTGSITLTASQSLFKSGHVGALFKIQSYGQSQSATLAGISQTTDSIFVTGTNREFTVAISGTWSGVIKLERSIGEEGAWEIVKSYTASGTSTWDDGLDNQEIYYRLDMTGYTSGSAYVVLTYSGGVTKGIVKIKSYVSSTLVTADVLSPLGKTSATTDWYEGLWSDYRGYPTACRFIEGRLVFVGRDRFVASVSDAFESFDDEIEGNSSPINRTIGSGPVDSIKWILDLNRVAAGGEAQEHVFFSSSLDEPLTNDNINRRSPTTQGSASIDAVRVGGMGVFVQRSGTRLYSFADSGQGVFVDDDLTKFYPEAGESTIVRVAVQRQPDTRLHVVCGDGTAFVQIYSKIDELNCIVKVETDGLIEDVVIMPGALEDKVYYTVLRTIDGVEVRSFERWALESECQGGLLNKQADSFVCYDGSATTDITVSHLEGKTVVVWADGKDVGEHVVAGGQITLSTAASKVVVGLPYEAQYQSVKISYGTEMGSSFGIIKSVFGFAPILKNTHAQGLKYGPTFDELDDMPLVEDGAEVDQDKIWDTYEKISIEFDSDYEEDPRICLLAAAPCPCTVLGMVIHMEALE